MKSGTAVAVPLFCMGFDCLFLSWCPAFPHWVAGEETEKLLGLFVEKTGEMFGGKWSKHKHIILL